MKYIVAAFIAVGAMLSVSAQAAPLSPASVQTEQAIATGGAVEKVCGGGGCGLPYWWRYCPLCGQRLYRPCGYYGWGCGVRWWPYRSWGYGGGWGGGWGGGYGGGWGGGGW
jgi:hypothetical protein